MSYQPDGDIAGLLESSLEIELAGFGRYRVEEETEELIVLEAIDGLRVDKRDPRLRGPQVGWVRYGGAIVRVAAARGDVSLVVAHGSSLGPKLGMSWGTTFRQGIAFRWVRGDKLAPVDARGFDPWPPNAPVLDDAFRRAIETHAYLRDSTGTRRIIEESSDAFTLEGSLLVLKGDPAFTGAYGSLVNYAGQLLRIARELPSHVLAVAHPSLGRDLGFAPLALSPDHEVLGTWLARSEIEVTTLAGHRHTEVPGELMPLARRGRVTLAGANVPDGFRVGDEDPDTIAISCEDRAERPDLVALGFSRRFVDARAIHVYSQIVAKTDPRLGGFGGLVEHAGYRLRVIERERDRAFVVASDLRAYVLELERDGETASGWVPDLGDAPPRPVLDEAVIAGLAAHNRVHYVPLGRMLLVDAESSATLTLAYTSEAGEDSALIGAGFTCVRSEMVERWGSDVTWEHTLAVPKQASSMSGPFERWVRYRGHPLRAIREQGDHVLLVAHPGFGKAMGFANVWPGGAIIDVSCRWVRRDACEAV
jgi:hypothetical protein